MTDERSGPPSRPAKRTLGTGARLMLASPIMSLRQGRVTALVAAHPDRRRPGHYVLEATLVAEQPLEPALRVVVQWDGGRRTARVDSSGMARLRGIPAHILQSVRDGEPTAILLQIDEAVSESDALA